MDKEIFGLGDEVWNIALIGPREGVSKVKACEKLVELSESVGDVITASKILRDAPKQVRVKASNLEAFKDVFETAEFFHYQRWLLPLPFSREVWITVSNPDEELGKYVHIALTVLKDKELSKHLRGGQIVLEDENSITFDRRP